MRELALVTQRRIFVQSVNQQHSGNFLSVLARVNARG
jgi:hypothetical protein